MGNCSFVNSRYTLGSDNMKKHPDPLNKSTSQLKLSKSDHQNISKSKETEMPKPPSKSIQSPQTNYKKPITSKSPTTKSNFVFSRRDNVQVAPCNTRIPVPIATLGSQKLKSPDSIVGRSLDTSLNSASNSNSSATTKQSTNSYDSGFDSNRSSCITNTMKLSSVEEDNVSYRKSANNDSLMKTDVTSKHCGTLELKEQSSQNIIIKNPFQITGPIKRPQSLSCESEQLINRLNRSSTTDESSTRLRHSVKRPCVKRSSICASICMDNPSVMYDISYLKLMLYKLRRLLTEDGDDKNLEDMFVSDSLFRDSSHDFQNEDISKMTKEELEQKYRLLVERNGDLEKLLKSKDRTIAKLNSQKNSVNHEKMSLLRDSTFKN